MCKNFEDFEAQFGSDVAEDVLTRIVEKAYYENDRARDTDVKINDIYKHNIMNWTISGTILYETIEYGFIIANGDWNGTEIIEWGLADDVGYYEPDRPTEIIIAPLDYPNTVVNDPKRFARYIASRNDPDVKDLLFSYQHDKFFDPKPSTVNYWHNKAKAKGLQFVEKIPEVSNSEERGIIFYNGPRQNFRNNVVENLGFDLEVFTNGYGIMTAKTTKWKIWIGSPQNKIEEYRFEGDKKSFHADMIALKMLSQ